MEPWRATVEPTRGSVRLLATDPDHNELLKAVLPPRSDHPRALLTLLEGVALWSGAPLGAAIAVGPHLDPRCAEVLFGGALWPADSALVRFDVVEVPRRRRTIAGLGDFRQLRLLHRRRS
jgi:hypothetical protein